MKRIFDDNNLEATLNLDKLIVSGHSMGAATALMVGEKDPRVKCVLTHDPWVNVIQEDLPTFDQLLSKNIQVTTSS